MINLKNPYLFAPAGPTNYDKATYIVTSNLFLFPCPRQANGFPWNPYPQRHISAKRVFLKFIPVFLMLTFQIIYQYPRCEINTPDVSQYKENWTWHNFWDSLPINTFSWKTLQHVPELSHSMHRGINPSQKHPPPYFLPSPLQIFQAPFFRQFPIYIVFLWPPSLKIGKSP